LLTLVGHYAVVEKFRDRLLVSKQQNQNTVSKEFNLNKSEDI